MCERNKKKKLDFLPKEILECDNGNYKMTTIRKFNMHNYDACSLISYFCSYIVTKKI